MEQKVDEKSYSKPSGVTELLERRATIQQWLERLEAQRGTVSESVLARVRADYEGRLRETLDTLRAHREGIEAELNDAIERLTAAEADHSAMAERLEEGHLRHAIGEIPAEAWSRERSDLEQSVDSALEKANEAKTEAARLREVLSQLGSVDGAPDGLKTSDSSGPIVEESVKAAPLPATESPEGDFLGDIDRVLSTPADEEQVEDGASPVVGEEDEEDTAPKPGLKCTECGYTNDLSAWFCGVCGADVG